MFDPETRRLAEAVIAAATARGLTVASVESCTGGLVAAALTAIPGSSSVLDRGFVTYSNAAKTEMVGVPASLIEAHGAVSEPVARAMAQGGAGTARVDLCVSITGIAGPGGGSIDKPVGLVHFATHDTSGTTHARHQFDDQGRDAIRDMALKTALAMLLDRLNVL